jgi:hypothetical protein
MASKNNKNKKPGTQGANNSTGRKPSVNPPVRHQAASRRPTVSPRRAEFERRSFPYMARLTAMPRWLLIIAIGSSLLLGLVLSGSFAWLGAIFLLFLAIFLGWLLALSWPLLSGGRRFIRLLVVLALIGLAFYKVTGQL